MIQQAPRHVCTSCSSSSPAVPRCEPSNGHPLSRPAFQFVFFLDLLPAHIAPFTTLRDLQALQATCRLAHNVIHGPPQQRPWSAEEQLTNEANDTQPSTVKNLIRDFASSSTEAAPTLDEHLHQKTEQDEEDRAWLLQRQHALLWQHMLGHQFSDIPLRQLRDWAAHLHKEARHTQQRLKETEVSQKQREDDELDPEKEGQTAATGWEEDAGSFTCPSPPQEEADAKEETGVAPVSLPISAFASTTPPGPAAVSAGVTWNEREPSPLPGLGCWSAKEMPNSSSRSHSRLQFAPLGARPARSAHYRRPPRSSETAPSPTAAAEAGNEAEMCHTTDETEEGTAELVGTSTQAAPPKASAHHEDERQRKAGDTDTARGTSSTTTQPQPQPLPPQRRPVERLVPGEMAGAHHASGSRAPSLTMDTGLGGQGSRGVYYYQSESLPATSRHASLPARSYRGSVERRSASPRAYSSAATGEAPTVTNGLLTSATMVAAPLMEEPCAALNEEEEEGDDIYFPWRQFFVWVHEHRVGHVVRELEAVRAEAHRLVFMASSHRTAAPATPPPPSVSPRGVLWRSPPTAMDCLCSAPPAERETGSLEGDAPAPVLPYTFQVPSSGPLPGEHTPDSHPHHHLPRDRAAWVRRSDCQPRLRGRGHRLSTSSTRPSYPIAAALPRTTPEDHAGAMSRRSPPGAAGPATSPPQYPEECKHGRHDERIASGAHTAEQAHCLYLPAHHETSHDGVRKHSPAATAVDERHTPPSSAEAEMQWCQRYSQPTIWSSSARQSARHAFPLPPLQQQQPHGVSPPYARQHHHQQPASFSPVSSTTMEHGSCWSPTAYCQGQWTSTSNAYAHRIQQQQQQQQQEEEEREQRQCKLAVRRLTEAVHSLLQRDEEEEDVLKRAARGAFAPSESRRDTQESLLHRLLHRSGCDAMEAEHQHAEAAVHHAMARGSFYTSSAPTTNPFTLRINGGERDTRYQGRRAAPHFVLQHPEVTNAFCALLMERAACYQSQQQWKLALQDVCVVEALGGRRSFAKESLVGDSAVYAGPSSPPVTEPARTTPLLLRTIHSRNMDAHTATSNNKVAGSVSVDSHSAASSPHPNRSISTKVEALLETIARIEATRCRASVNPLLCQRGSWYQNNQPLDRHPTRQQLLQAHTAYLASWCTHFDDAVLSQVPLAGLVVLRRAEYAYQQLLQLTSSSSDTSATSTYLFDPALPSVWRALRHALIEDQLGACPPPAAQEQLELVDTSFSFSAAVPPAKQIRTLRTLVWRLLSADGLATKMEGAGREEEEGLVSGQEEQPSLQPACRVLLQAIRDAPPSSAEALRQCGAGERWLLKQTQQLRTCCVRWAEAHQLAHLSSSAGWNESVSMSLLSPHSDDENRMAGGDRSRLVTQEIEEVLEQLQSAAQARLEFYGAASPYDGFYWWLLLCLRIACAQSTKVLLARLHALKEAGERRAMTARQCAEEEAVARETEVVVGCLLAWLIVTPLRSDQIEVLSALAQLSAATPYGIFDPYMDEKDMEEEQQQQQQEQDGAERPAAVRPDDDAAAAPWWGSFLCPGRLERQRLRAWHRAGCCSQQGGPLPAAPPGPSSVPGGAADPSAAAPLPPSGEAPPECGALQARPLLYAVLSLHPSHLACTLTLSQWHLEGDRPRLAAFYLTRSLFAMAYGPSAFIQQHHRRSPLNGAVVPGPAASYTPFPYPSLPQRLAKNVLLENAQQQQRSAGRAGSASASASSSSSSSRLPSATPPSRVSPPVPAKHMRQSSSLLELLGSASPRRRTTVGRHYRSPPPPTSSRAPAADVGVEESTAAALDDQQRSAAPDPVAALLLHRPLEREDDEGSDLMRSLCDLDSARRTPGPGSPALEGWRHETEQLKSKLCRGAIPQLLPSRLFLLRSQCSIVIQLLYPSEADDDNEEEEEGEGEARWRPRIPVDLPLAARLHPRSSACARLEAALRMDAQEPQRAIRLLVSVLHRCLRLKDVELLLRFAVDRRRHAQRLAVAHHDEEEEDEVRVLERCIGWLGGAFMALGGAAPPLGPTKPGGPLRHHPPPVAGGGPPSTRLGFLSQGLAREVCTTTHLSRFLQTLRTGLREALQEVSAAP